MWRSCNIVLKDCASSQPPDWFSLCVVVYTLSGRNMVDLFLICERVIKLLWKLVQGNQLFTCSCWSGLHTHPRSDRDLMRIHQRRSHTYFLQSLKDRHERLSPGRMGTKALAGAIWIEPMAPVACLPLPHSVFTGSPLRACKSNNTSVPQTDWSEG